MFFRPKVKLEKVTDITIEILNKYNSKTLITAHHGDDQIETVMMKIVRGSTLKGYSGIEKVSDRSFYKIYRPLLYLTKEDIYRYAADNNISYCEDYTNHSDEYTRNRYRKYLLPFLEITNGIHWISNNIQPLYITFPLVLTLTSFGGFCAIAQTNSMIQESKLSIVPYIIQKLITALVTSLLAMIYIQFIHQ